MSRLWDRGGSGLGETLERFTVGRDPELDLRLVPYDALASMAHAIMLKEIGVLGSEEIDPLRRELAQAAREAREGTFVIARSQEDGHTALENRLTERLGETGRRIHTGRSRNDQVIAAVRLWGREKVLEQAAGLLAVVAKLLDLAEEHRETSLPGYTHTRQAMPSTLGFYFLAWADNLLDAGPWLESAFNHLNRSPLGSASGFGVALPLDRVRVAALLSFSGVQESTLAVQSDRGKAEMLALGAALGPATDLGRMATDLISWSSDELRFLTLDGRVTTGSSIMPQKRNPDVLELIRAGAARVRARHAEIGAIVGSVGAGYHRDLQLTKEPFLEGMQAVADLVQATAAVLDHLQVHPDRCRAAVQPATAATDAVYTRVAAGEPFRTAYKAFAADPEAAVTDSDDPSSEPPSKSAPSETWRRRTHLGAPGSLLDPGAFTLYRDRLDKAHSWIEAQGSSIRTPWGLLESSGREQSTSAPEAKDRP